MNDAASPAPAPVTSAKAALNAMLANRPAPEEKPTFSAVPTARELMNAAAAANQNAEQHSKSASSIHHGSIKSVESTRMSASALLKRRDEENINRPIVHTSLVLGGDARPPKKKPAPIVLPPHSRVVEQARPTAARPAPKAISTPDSDLAVQIISASKSAALKTKLGDARTLAPPRPAQRQIRDPQMLSGHSRVQVPASRPNLVNAEVVSATSVRRAPSASAGLAGTTAGVNYVPAVGEFGAAPAPQTQSLPRTRFRAAPRGHAMAQPGAMPVDNSYVMSAPPKITARSAANVRKDMAELGIIEAFESENVASTATQNAQNRAAISNLYATPSVRSNTPVPIAVPGHAAPANLLSAPASAPALPAEAQSPFLKSVSIEKRPLSGGAMQVELTQYGQPVTPPAAEEAKGKKHKSARKNRYSDRALEKPTLRTRRTNINRPTVIIPNTRRSKVPLVFLIIATILLGAMVGAAAYLCFFQ